MTFEQILSNLSDEEKNWLQTEKRKTARELGLFSAFIFVATMLLTILSSYLLISYFLKFEVSLNFLTVFSILTTTTFAYASYKFFNNARELFFISRK